MKYFKPVLVVVVALPLLGFGAVWLLGSADRIVGSNTEMMLQNLNDKVNEGDIIFQTSKSQQSKAIQLATGSKYSHMGMVYKEGDKLFVFEAVQPVKLTPLNEWIKRGEKSHFVVKRLRNSRTILTASVLTKMKGVGKRFVGKNYDLYFEWSDTRIYCSELVWKIYKEAVGVEIGTLQHLSDFDLSNKSVKKIMRERYGDTIPLNEIVISPASMFESDKLEMIIAQ